MQCLRFVLLSKQTRAIELQPAKCNKDRERAGGWPKELGVNFLENEFL